jgi:anaerobic nitric oxide reductase flavorubredoxin
MLGAFEVTEASAMKKAIAPGVSWVGKVDWELKRFHGDEYSTWRGSSYNSYLVEDEKVALIDTVWMPYAREFVDGLDRAVGLDRIDFVIANHGEIDHSGSLPELLRRRPGLPVYCTANAVKTLRGHYHQDWDWRPVKTGSRLSLGARELVFVEAPMLHWPDSMMCYLTGEQLLFSNDAFGQHYATERLFNDLVDRDELYAEAIKYYANILTPFSALVTKKIEELTGLGLPIRMICPSHGVIWREDPLQIVRQYAAWADAYREDRIAVLYDTMWEGTRRLAEAVAAGIAEVSPSTTVVLHNCAKSDKNDVITEVFRSKAVLFGSPTVNRGILTSLAALFEEIRGLRFKGKKAGVFGCYGWSGESIAVLAEAAKAAGFEPKGDGLKALWNPDEASLALAVQYGRDFARGL